MFQLILISLRNSRMSDSHFRLSIFLSFVRRLSDTIPIFFQLFVLIVTDILNRVAEFAVVSFEFFCTLA